jgi:uncharacterized protein YbaR (Trm112 family)/SAM-dependent methyltransferase
MEVDSHVQEWIAGTNGRLYKPLVGKLKRYPIPPFPLPHARPGAELLLDVGCGWGRWMVSAARAGYLPLGIDIKLDAARAARRVLDAHGLRGYPVVADLTNPPFRAGVFDAVFSYSVLQHAHKRRARECIRAIHRSLRPGGACMLEFPSSTGLTNVLRGLTRPTAAQEDYDSWDVRYYGIDELRSIFEEQFGNFDYSVDCYFGIGVQASDLDILPWRYKPLPVASEILKRVADRLPPLKRIADSIYVRALRQADGDARPEARPTPATFELFDVLACPLTGNPLHHDARANELISEEAKLAYPIEDGIPVMLPGSARKL